MASMFFHNLSDWISTRNQKKPRLHWEQTRSGNTMPINGDCAVGQQELARLPQTINMSKLAKFTRTPPSADLLLTTRFPLPQHGTGLEILLAFGSSKGSTTTL